MCSLVKKIHAVVTVSASTMIMVCGIAHVTEGTQAMTVVVPS